MNDQLIQRVGFIVVYINNTEVDEIGYATYINATLTSQFSLLSSSTFSFIPSLFEDQTNGGFDGCVMGLHHFELGTDAQANKYRSYYFNATNSPVD